MPQPSPISAASRTLAILEFLAGRIEGAGVGQVSGALEIEMSVTSRLLATLEMDGYVRRLEYNDRFVLSLKLPGLVQRHFGAMSVPEICMPELRDLAGRVGELVQLAFVDGSSVRFIARAEGGQRVNIRGLVGFTAHPDTMATGRAWLAFLPASEVLQILAASQGNVPVRSKPELGQLMAELDRVRGQGYAMEIENNVEDVAAIAAPVWAGSPERVVAVVTVSGPSYRLETERLQALAPEIQECAARLAASWPAVALALHGEAATMDASLHEAAS